MLLCYCKSRIVKLRYSLYCSIQKTKVLKFPRLTISDLAFAVLLWVLLILRYGYTFGTNDHIELLPYVLFLKNPALFPHDLFIQSLHASQPNERTVIAHLLLPFASCLKPAIFLLHFLNTVLLLLALIKLAKRFIISPYVAWLAVYVSVLVLNDKGLGNVDLYTPAIQTSDVSCMIIAWGLNVFLDRKYILASVVMALATFIHVLEGFDVMAVMCAVMFIKFVWDKEISLKEFISFISIYFLTAGVYLFFIYRAKTSGAGALSSHEVFEIMFAFRHPHHFIFSTFPVFNKVLFAIYTLAAMVFYGKWSRSLFLFISVSLLGLIVYIVCVDVLQLVFVANFQWYKVVQWMKIVGVIAAFALVFNYLEAYILNKSRLLNIGVSLAAVAACSFMFYQFACGKFDHGTQQYNEAEIALCEKVKNITPMDAVFIQPFEMTALKFYGQRSSYVEFKAIAKNQKDLKIWYERVQEVFGLSYEVDKSGFDMQGKADEHLDNLTEEQLVNLKKEGVTNMICPTAKYGAAHKLLLSENGYYVYEL